MSSSSHKKRAAKFGHQKLAARALALHMVDHRKTIKLWCDQCHEEVVFDGMGCMKCEPDEAEDEP